MLSRAKKARNSLASATLTLEAVGTRKFSSPTVNSRQARGLKKSDVLKQPIFVESSDLSYEEFCRDRNYVGLEAEANETLDLLLENLQKRVELVTSECGILQPTEKIYAKLVKSFFEAGKVKELAEFLIKANKEDVPVAIENSTSGKSSSGNSFSGYSNGSAHQRQFKV
ncbi:hypothetical protein IFM89_032227 [Coptis chinensis]|uniref:Uncharacterized protein n=1 Tax=Coptis chinensis TaxID=261450 RepID=A0A835HWP3_9MAGN|nr:hypothetical protein IFM89_032227 [Coptis chinensis]